MGIFDKIDRTILRNIQVTHLIRKENQEFQDSYEFGTPGRSGTVKIYHTMDDPEGFQKKIDAGIALQKYTQMKLQESSDPTITLKK